MKILPCPHCDKPRIPLRRAPKGVVVVLTCPSCRGLVVLFQKKAIAVNRPILEKGTFEERKEHIAEIITEFLDPDMFSEATLEALSQGGPPFLMGSGGEFEDDESEIDADDEASPPISEKEVRQFIELDLTRIDEDAYFRKHFG
jgi:hypothetical protein